MNQLMTIGVIFITLLSCGNGASAEKKTTKSTSKQAKNVVQSTSNKTTSPAPIDGASEKNRGENKGKVAIYGTIERARNGIMVYLYETKGKNHYAIDSVKTEGKNFAFKRQELYNGFYMISLLNDRNMTTFIVNPESEQDIQLNFMSQRLDSDASSPNSKENEGWFAYNRIEKQIDSKIKQLRQSRKNSSFRERINKQINEQEKLKIDTQQEYIKNYQDTYLSKFLGWKTANTKSDMATYWADVDFSDRSILRCTAIPDRIQDFMRSFADGTDGSFYNCADVLKELASQGKKDDNDDVLQFVLFTMADGFYQSGKENVTLYIIDNHILGEDCGMEPGDMLQTFIENVNDLQLGGTPPNIVMNDSDGKRLDLHKYAKQGEYTLLIFWASWCHKCEQEMPVLNKVYDQYSPDGFQVVAFSIDQSEAQWKKGIEEKDVPGRNISELSGWSSKTSKDYRVTQTPTSFLIDSKGKVVLKPKRIFEVDQFLRQNIK